MHSQALQSSTQADQKALVEYAEFNRTQKVESDFGRVLKATKVLGLADVKPESKPPRKKK
ncbi:MAG: hypothetical protein PHP70_00010 [Gallionella sp.]|nr:hypothetical protein [Gallionella sp.]